MVATFFQLDHGSTVVTSLPSCLLCSFKELVCLLVFGAIFGSMPFAVTLAADLGLTSSTLAVFSPVLPMHAPGSDPFATPSGRTIDTIFRRVFLEFLVPCLLEIDIK